ncbi:hypothetical protein [Paludisphaera rhizosphaerae]|uniref:hypothetical protein n=1 Tax=Paludisphaera rhizosphaerae TaxID=2711216 RepID=UPI0013EB9B30|nr:hypothetical protein [Paludisphaera rhizosphaerae]
MSRAGAWRAAILVLAFTGCGGDEEFAREAVEGTISFDGKPMEGGVVAFVPTEGAGPGAGGEIEAGRFSIAGSEGPTPGPHLVTVT